MHAMTHPPWQIYHQQEDISQREIVFHFQKDIQSDKSWSFDINASAIYRKIKTKTTQL